MGRRIEYHLGFEVSSLGFQVQNFGFGVWGLGFGLWGLWFGVWGLGFGAEIDHLNSRRDAREVERERLSGPEARLDAHLSVQGSGIRFSGSSGQGFRV